MMTEEKYYCSYIKCRRPNARLPCLFCIRSHYCSFACYAFDYEIGHRDICSTSLSDTLQKVFNLTKLGKLKSLSQNVAILSCNYLSFRGDNSPPTIIIFPQPKEMLDVYFCVICTKPVSMREYPILLIDENYSDFNKDGWKIYYHRCFDCIKEKKDICYDTFKIETSACHFKQKMLTFLFICKYYCFIPSEIIQIILGLSSLLKCCEKPHYQ
jgi:hypothetical protein